MGVLGDSVFPKFALGLLVAMLLMHFVSFGTPHWAKTKHDAKRREHIGLWRYCTYPHNGGERCDDFVNKIESDWMKAAQAFMTLGMFVLIGAVGIVAVYALVPDMEGDTRMLIICLAVITVAGVFNIIGVAVFGARYQEYFNDKEPGRWMNVAHLSWSFSLAVTVCVGIFISGVFMTIEFMQIKDIN